jgi:hypothetical protein
LFLGAKFGKTVLYNKAALMPLKSLGDHLMKKIVACLVILLAFSPLVTFIAPEVHAETSDVKILSYNYYFDSIGYLDIVGEIQNIGSNTIANVTINSVVTGSSGVQVQQSDLSFGDNLLPGQKAPFYIEIHSQSGYIGTWDGGDITDISLSIANAPATSNYLYQDISISNQVHGNVNGVYWANGTITNTGSQTATRVLVYGTFYNSKGEVVAVGWSGVTQTLAPGASAQFTTPAYDRNQTEVSSEDKVASYSLLVQLLSPVLTGAAPTIYPTSNPTTSNPTGTTSSSPTPNNNSANDQLLYAAIIVAVVIAAIIAAFVVLRKRKSKKEPQTPAKPVKQQKSKRKNRK